MLNFGAVIDGPEGRDEEVPEMQHQVWIPHMPVRHGGGPVRVPGNRTGEQDLSKQLGHKSRQGPKPKMLDSIKIAGLLGDAGTLGTSTSSHSSHASPMSSPSTTRSEGIRTSYFVPEGLQLMQTPRLAPIRDERQRGTGTLSGRAVSPFGGSPLGGSRPSTANSVNRREMLSRPQSGRGVSPRPGAHPPPPPPPLQSPTAHPGGLKPQLQGHLSTPSGKAGLKVELAIGGPRTGASSPAPPKKGQRLRIYEAQASQAVLQALKKHLPVAMENLLPPGLIVNHGKSDEQAAEEEIKKLGRLLLQALVRQHNCIEGAFRFGCDMGSTTLTRNGLEKLIRGSGAPGPVKRLPVSKFFEKIDTAKNGYITMEAWLTYFQALSEGGGPPTTRQATAGNLWLQGVGNGPLGGMGAAQKKDPVQVANLAPGVEVANLADSPPAKVPGRVEPAQSKQAAWTTGIRLPQAAGGKPSQPSPSQPSPKAAGGKPSQPSPSQPSPKASAANSSPRHVLFSSQVEEEPAPSPKAEERPPRGSPKRWLLDTGDDMPHLPESMRMGRRAATFALRDAITERIGSVARGQVPRASVVEAAGKLEELIAPKVEQLVDEVESHGADDRRLSQAEWKDVFSSMLETVDLGPMEVIDEDRTFHSEEHLDHLDHFHQPRVEMDAKVLDIQPEEPAHEPPAPGPHAEPQPPEPEPSRGPEEVATPKHAAKEHEFHRSRASESKTSERKRLSKRKTADLHQQELIKKAQQVIDMAEPQKFEEDTNDALEEMVLEVEAELQKLLPDFTREYTISDPLRAKAILEAARRCGYSSIMPRRRNCIMILREGQQLEGIRRQLAGLHPGCSVRIKELSRPMKAFVQELSNKMGLTVIWQGLDNNAEGSELDVLNLSGSLEELTVGIRKELARLPQGASREYPSGMNAQQKRAVKNVVTALGYMSKEGKGVKDSVTVGNYGSYTDYIRRELLKLPPGQSKVFTHLSMLEEMVVKMVAEELGFEVPTVRRSRRLSTGALPVTVRRPRPADEPSKKEPAEGDNPKPPPPPRPTTLQPGGATPDDDDESDSDSDYGFEHVKSEHIGDSRARVEAVFKRYATTSPKNDILIFLKKPGLGKFIEDALEIQREKHIETEHAEIVKEDLDAIFDDTVQLQLDMGMGCHQRNGLTLEFFQVFFSKAQAKLGWKLVRFLFSVLVQSGMNATFGAFPHRKVAGD